MENRLVVVALLLICGAVGVLGFVFEIPKGVEEKSLFGMAVASNDDFVAIAAPGGNPYGLVSIGHTSMRGYVCVYQADGSLVYVLTSPYNNTLDFFGASLSISNGLLFVGCPNCEPTTGHVLVYDLENCDTNLCPILFDVYRPLSVAAGFGAVVASDEDWLLISDFSENQRRVFLYHSSDMTTWSERFFVTGYSTYGTSLALRVLDDLDVAIAIGFPDYSSSLVNVGRVDCFTISNASAAFPPAQVLVKGEKDQNAWDMFGASVAFTYDGQALAVGLPRIYPGNSPDVQSSDDNATELRAGQVNIFLRKDGNYSASKNVAMMTPSTTDNNWFGFALALTTYKSGKLQLFASAPAYQHNKDFDGKDPSAGKMYMYEGEDGSSTWMLKRDFSGVSDADGYGWAIAATKKLVVTGAPFASGMNGYVSTMDPSNLPLQPLTIVGIVISAVTILAMIATFLVALYFRVYGVDKVKGTAYARLP